MSIFVCETWNFCSVMNKVKRCEEILEDNLSIMLKLIISNSRSTRNRCLYNFTEENELKFHGNRYVHHIKRSKNFHNRWRTTSLLSLSFLIRSDQFSIVSEQNFHFYDHCCICLDNHRRETSFVVLRLHRVYCEYFIVKSTS